MVVIQHQKFKLIFPGFGWNLTFKLLSLRTNISVFGFPQLVEHFVSFLPKTAVTGSVLLTHLFSSLFSMRQQSALCKMLPNKNIPTWCHHHTSKLDILVLSSRF